MQNAEPEGHDREELAMNTLLGACAAVTAVVAAARSTWSPCGVSMLATITPLAERGRGHRYRSTATWFVAGAVAGGATLGLCLLALAAALRAAGLSPTLSVSVGCGAAVVAAAADTGIAGFRLPVHHRQVNERWLDGFRPWVYGAGFGWQIGTGVVTYIKTAAVYLLIVLAALTASPLLALGLGVLFGLVRGLAVFLGRGITKPGRPGGVPPALHGLRSGGAGHRCRLRAGGGRCAGRVPVTVGVRGHGRSGGCVGGNGVAGGTAPVWRLLAVATPRLRVRPAQARLRRSCRRR